MLLAITVVGQQANGQIFAPIRPTPCDTGMDTVGYRYIGHNDTSAKWGLDLAENAYDPGTYLPDVSVTRWFYTNNWVQWFDFWVPYFDSETGYDYLHYGQPYIAEYGITGGQDNANFWYFVRLSTSASFQAVPAYFYWHSDATNQLSGFNIDGVRVCSGSSPDNNTTFLPEFTRNTGVLLGTGDVIYFQVAGTQGPDHYTFALWGDYPNDYDNNLDFDLYARCGAPPTPTAWDFRGYSSDTNEFIHANNDSSCSAGWWLAVNSYNGAGMFNLEVMEHYVSDHVTTATATILDWDDAGQYQIWQNSWAAGYREYFGATKGALYIENLDIWNNNGNNDAYWIFSDSCGRSDAYKACSFFAGGAPTIYWFDSTNSCNPDWHLDRTIAHEASHDSSGLDDEYSGSYCGNCGHTIMDTGFTGTNYNFCTNADHDSAHANGCGSAPGGPGWSNSCLLNMTPYRPYETPDNYSFELFDFNDMAFHVNAH